MTPSSHAHTLARSLPYLRHWPISGAENNGGPVLRNLARSANGEGHKFTYTWHHCYATQPKHSRLT